MVTVILPYRRLFLSALELMKNSESQPKKELDKIYSSVGDAVHARSICELPEASKIYTALDIKFLRFRNLREIANLNRLFSWMNYVYY